MFLAMVSSSHSFQMQDNANSRYEFERAKREMYMDEIRG